MSATNMLDLWSDTDTPLMVADLPELTPREGVWYDLVDRSSKSWRPGDPDVSIYLDGDRVAGDRAVRELFVELAAYPWRVEAVASDSEFEAGRPARR